MDYVIMQPVTVDVMTKVNLFIGRERDLVAYNGQALINYAIEFYTDACNNDLDTTNNKVPFDFSNFVTGYFLISNERNGRIIKLINDVSPSGPYLVINSDNMIFDANGVYYYEIGYVQSGGYDIVLMFGKINVI